MDVEVDDVDDDVEVDEVEDVEVEVELAEEDVEVDDTVDEEDESPLEPEPSASKTTMLALLPLGTVTTQKFPPPAPVA